MGSVDNSEATTSILDKAFSATDHIMVSSIRNENPLTALLPKLAGGDFGKFAFKDLIVLEKANKDAIQQLKAQAIEAQDRSSESPGGSYNQTPEKDRYEAVTQDFDDHPHEPLSPVQSTSGFPSPQSGNPLRISTSTVEEHFEYINPSDLARHDLDHDGLPRLAERPEVFDRGYYRPSVDATSDFGRANARQQRAPPPTRPSSDFNRSNRAAAAVIYDNWPATNSPELVQDSAAATQGPRPRGR